MTTRTAGTLLLLAACVGDSARDGRHGGASRPGSAATFEVRVLRGSVERASLVGRSHILVQIDEDGVYLYPRRGGERIVLDAWTPGLRWLPEITWSTTLADDRVVAYDFQNRRLTEFDTSGVAVRATSLAAPKATPAPVAAFADGGLLVLRDYLPNPYAQETGRYADTTALLPVTADAEPRGEAISITMSERHGVPAEQRPGDAARSARVVGAVNPGVFDGRQRYSVAMPLSPRTHVAAARDHAYLGTSGDGGIRVLEPDGSERRRFRIAEDARPLDAAMRARLRDELMRRADPEFRALYEQLVIPDRAPRYRRLFADAAGRLWVERYPLPGDEQVQWSVYSPDGLRIGGLVVQDDERLLDANLDHLLLARSGLMGSTRVQVLPYSLR